MLGFSKYVDIPSSIHIYIAKHNCEQRNGLSLNNKPNIACLLFVNFYLYTYHGLVDLLAGHWLLDE